MSRLRTMAEKSLVTAGVTSALSGVVIAVVANVPGDGGNEYQRTGRRPDDPESWSTGLALALTFACLAWVWALWATRNAQIGRRRRARAVASSVFAAGCAAALVVVVLRMPTPGPSGGVDMSLPLMLLAFALAAVGALATATSSLCRPDEDFVDGTVPRLAVGIGSVAVVPLLAVAVAVGVVPSWPVAMNTEGVTTERPAPAA